MILNIVPKFVTRADVIELARLEGGKLMVVRYDRDLGEMVEDVITSDMPEEEIVL